MAIQAQLDKDLARIQIIHDTAKDIDRKIMVATSDSYIKQLAVLRQEFNGYAYIANFGRAQSAYLSYDLANQCLSGIEQRAQKLSAIPHVSVEAPASDGSSLRGRISTSLNIQTGDPDRRHKRSAAGTGAPVDKAHHPKNESIASASLVLSEVSDEPRSARDPAPTPTGADAPASFGAGAPESNGAEAPASTGAADSAPMAVVELGQVNQSYRVSVPDTEVKAKKCWCTIF